jgi:hypothetical protein
MPKLLGDIKGYCLHLDTGFETIHAMKELEGKRVEVSIKEWKNTRSNRANRYYWSVVIPSVFQAFAENGIKLINTNQGHEMLRRKFLMEEVKINGKPFMIPKSTTEMKVDEFANYIFVVVEYLRDFYNYTVPKATEQF